MNMPSEYDRHAGDRAGFGLGAVVASAAAINHYNATGDWQIAARKGFGAFVRIMSWLFLAFWWGVCFVLVTTNADLEARRTFGLVLLLVTPMFGVLWCRNADYCLFRRGPIQWVFRPIARLFEWLPTLGIYLIVLVPTFISLGS